MSKVLFLYNTRSGNHNLEPSELIARVKFSLKPGQDLVVHKILKKKEGDEGIINKINDGEWDLVIVGGGDGTIRRLAGVMLENDYHFPIAILPLGSANGLATCLEIDDLDVALATLSSSTYFDMDILCLNDKISLHLSDFGFNAGLVKKFDESDERGMFAYFKGSISEIFENEPQKFQLIIDQKVIDIEARMLMVANGSMYGTGAKINPTGKLDDGLFEVIAFNPIGINELVRFSVNLIRGEANNDGQVRTWKVDHAIIKNLGNSKFQIDGDVESDVDEVQISIIKNRLKIMIPSKNIGDVSAN